MSIATLVNQYGYAAVFVGTFLEGETVLLLGGFAAHRGLLGFPQVLLLAFVASTLGDQCFFWLGRRHGAWIFGRFPALGRQLPKVQRLLDRHHTPLILAMRFLYGLRTAGPLAMGALGVPPGRFALLNMLGAAIWSVLVAGIGYHFGTLLQSLLPHLHRAEEAALAAAAVAALAWWLLRWLGPRLRRS